MSALLSIFTFVIAVGLLVTFHELCHYLMARALGITALRFSIGFGPKLFGWKDRQGCEWLVAAFPLGGFVQLKGRHSVAETDTSPVPSYVVGCQIPNRPEDVVAAHEIDTDDHAFVASDDGKADDCFESRPLSQRALVVAAGPFGNYLLGFLLLSAVYLGLGVAQNEPIISEVFPGKPAAEAGLRPGDRIMGIDGITVTSFDQVGALITSGQPVKLTYNRSGSIQTSVLMPYSLTLDQDTGQPLGPWRLGMTSDHITYREQSLSQALGRAGNDLLELSVGVVRTLALMLTGQQAFETVGGPLRLAEMSGEVAERSAKVAKDSAIGASVALAQIAAFVAVLSINVAVFNLLPFPNLDGGHLLFYAIEKVRGRPVPPQFTELMYRVALALLIALFIAVTTNDFVKLLTRV